MASSLETGQVSVRLTGIHSKALERYRVSLQKRIRSTAPGWNCSTAHAIRDLILRGLKDEGFLTSEEVFD